MPPKGKTSIVLPDMVDMTLEQFNTIYPQWLRWRATDKRFLPVRGGLRDQPTFLMDGLLFLDSIFENLVALNNEQE